MKATPSKAAIRFHGLARMMKNMESKAVGMRNRN
jgi:hypothetical protein